jgi:prepilin-type N-terminal cleavage/methylation domain-containing protein
MNRTPSQNIASSRRPIAGRQHSVPSLTSLNARRRCRAFTLIEIMIVVLIIGILLSIAMPNLVYTREKTRSKACAGNLRRIQWAKDCYLMDYSRPITDTPPTDKVYGPTGYIREAPLCPSSGTYTINAGNADPICTVGGSHNINAEAIL